VTKIDGIFDQTISADERIKPLLDEWQEQLDIEKRACDEKRRIRNAIIMIMSRGKMDIGKYRLTRFAISGKTVLQIREMSRREKHDG
jgi:hypothetical protein